MIALVEPVLAEQGLELVDVEHRPEGRGQVVRLLVDREGGVDLETLSRLSRELSVLFDVEEPVAGHYTLEVSSPGIHRPLRKPEHFVRYLHGDEGAETTIDFSNLEKANYEHEFSAADFGKRAVPRGGGPNDAS